MRFTRPVRRPISIALLASVTLGLLLAVPAEASSAEISITPAVGHPLQHAVVRGSGFEPNEVVDLAFDKLVFGAVIADASGSFVFRKRVPSAALPGPAHVYAHGTQSNVRAKVRFLVRTNWPMFRGGPAHSGYNPYENVLSPSTVSGLTEIWSFPTAEGIFSSPAVVNGVVYVGSYDDNLYALDASTGEKLWSFNTGDWVYASPAVVNGVVYVGSYYPAGALYALDASTGAELWSVPLEGGTRSSAVVSKGVVYVGASDGYLHAFDASTGEEIWRFYTGGSDSSPAVSNGTVYVGGNHYALPFYGTLWALDASTGAELWRFQAAYYVNSSPTVANRRVYFGSFDNYSYAFNALTGHRVWEIYEGGYIYASTASANGVVYLPGRELYEARDARTGAGLWDFGLADAYSSAAVANGVLYVGEGYPGTSVYAVDASTGAKLWSFSTGSSVLSSPAVVNGMVFVGTDGGTLYAFGLPGSVRG